ncbi:hypothetical protein TNCV_3397071 [Trichonephila clavipes]|nr:hypothetical protein TNCV_3397071 [Trichonephila clavipes]
MWVLQDAAKHGCDHLDALDRTRINMKKCLTIRVIFVHRTIEETPLCDTASRVAAAMVLKLRIHAAANVVELFIQTPAVLQTYPILDSGLITCLYVSLRQCG